MVLLCVALYAALAPMMLESTAATCDAKGERYTSGENADVEEALLFLERSNAEALQVANALSNAVWNYESNLTLENRDAMLEMQEKEAEFTKQVWAKATSFAWKNFEFSNNTVYRWFKHLSLLGNAALPIEKFNELNEIKANMQNIYGKAKICPYERKPSTPCNLTLEPDITEIVRTSRDYDELSHVWDEWRAATGRKMKRPFLRYVRLANEAACRNGFDDAGELWRESFGSATFESDVEALWQTLEPFYQHLHAYVRRMLARRYPLSGIRENGPIPAHLLGNMWGQTWGNIFDIVKPYPNKKFVDVTDTMKAKRMTPRQMFAMSEEFFTSLGLIGMTPEFWNRSILEKPADREMVCHASAWDFYNARDFRIKMCTTVTMEDLITIHHEMGHIEYFLQYSHLPQVFRNGANDGFHEAVGDTLALSVATPRHLQKIGLMDDAPDDYETDINTLMQKALEKIAFVPFGFLIDAWRWRVFDGSIKEDQLNTRWWELRLKYQGLCPPTRRTEDDLDAGAKYHIPGDVPYIRYFVSFVIQFQFHKSLCDEAGHRGPLHKCDIYRDEKAGKLLSEMLQLGSSVRWEDAMRAVTKGRTGKMEARAMLQYFEPLIEWLKEQNRGEVVGWNSQDPMMCP